MAEKKKTDDKTLQLIIEVNRQKDEIAKIEKPNYKTNCSFSYTQDGPGVNLHVESNVRELIMMAAHINSWETEYQKAAAVMGVEAPLFTWRGFYVADWLSDIKLRIAKVQIASKRKKLESLEARLNSIISPELRAEMELEAIARELK
jgi:hypothetical protein